MAKFKFKATTDVTGFFTAKLVGDITDYEVGKPFRLTTSSPDTYQLCADGEAIDAFLVAVDPATADGLHLGTLKKSGFVRCEADGALTIGGLVEAGAPAAIGTAETNALPKVSAKAAVAADLATDANGTLIAASVNALLAEALLPVPMWRVVSGDTTDGDVADEDTTVIIERVL